MRKIPKGMEGKSPLEIGMAARGFSTPIIEIWSVDSDDKNLTNTEKDKSISSNLFRQYINAAAWDGVQVILACVNEPIQL